MSRTFPWRMVFTVRAFLALLAPVATGDREKERVPNRPKVPGKLRLHLREGARSRPAVAS